MSASPAEKQAEKNRRLAKEVAQQEAARELEEAEKNYGEQHEYVLLGKPRDGDTVSIVDVYLGPEKKQYRLPTKIADALSSLLTMTSRTTTESRSRYNGMWEDVFADSNWPGPDHPDKSDAAPGPMAGVASHTTKRVELPDIAVDKFQAFADWVKKKRREAQTHARENRETYEKIRTAELENSWCTYLETWDKASNTSDEMDIIGGRYDLRGYDPAKEGGYYEHE